MVVVELPVFLPQPSTNRSAGSAGHLDKSGTPFYHALLLCLQLVENLLPAVWCQPVFFGGSANVRLRRKLLDVAVWCRDVLYTFSGHVSGAVIASAGPRPKQSSVRPPCGVFVGARAQVSAKYRQARDQSRAAADKFLSRFLSAQDAFEIALQDATTGDALDDVSTLEEIKRDLVERAADPFPFDPEARALHAAKVSALRSVGGAPGLTAVAPVLPRCPRVRTDPLYPLEDVDAVVATLNADSKALRLCNAATKAVFPLGRRLTCGLMNLSRKVCLTSTFWCFRAVSPIRKSGPRVVRRTKHVRPISVASDLASVADALWLLRNQTAVSGFCGPNQQGGIGEPLSLVLGLVLNAEIRSAQSLCTYWALTDLF